MHTGGIDAKLMEELPSCGRCFWGLVWTYIIDNLLRRRKWLQSLCQMLSIVRTKEYPLPWSLSSNPPFCCCSYYFQCPIWISFSMKPVMPWWIWQIEPTSHFSIPIHSLLWAISDRWPTTITSGRMLQDYSPAFWSPWSFLFCYGNGVLSIPFLSCWSSPWKQSLLVYRLPK